MFTYADPTCTIIRQNSAQVSEDPGLLAREAGTELSPLLNSVPMGKLPYPVRPGDRSSPASHPDTSSSEKDAACSPLSGQHPSTLSVDLPLAFPRSLSIQVDMAQSIFERESDTVFSF